MRVPDDFAKRLDVPGSPRPDLGLDETFCDASVVALLVPTSAERPCWDPDLVLIERANSMRNHAGQVALPGGKPDPGDGSLVATALREAQEEVGLPLEGTRVLGRLSPVPTPSRFLIWPFVAWAPAGWSPSVGSADEVAAVLTPSLSTLTAPGVHTVGGSGVWKGFAYEMHEFRIHEPPVWGATARIVWELLGHMRDD